MHNRAGSTGEVTAMEPSEMYLNYFKQYCSKQGWGNVKFIQSDVENADLPENYYDLIFARWVIGFNPDPALFISKLKESLSPGGIIAFQDYAFHGLYLYPRGGAYEKLAGAVEAYWKYSGGDISIAPKIPGIFKKIGIELIEYKPNSLAGGPGSGVFDWHNSFITQHVPLMVEKNLLLKEMGDAILNDWQRHVENPDSIFFSPIVVNISGRKP
jgi:ubiquinone/menaquinone biosynthesis C-methylase UbiE